MLLPHRTPSPIQTVPDPGSSGAAKLRHEVRGALSALLAAVEVLDQAPRDGLDARMAREVVRRQAQRLSVLIDELGRPPPQLQGVLAATAPRRRPARAVLLVAPQADRHPMASVLVRQGHALATAADGISGLRRLLESRPELALIQLELEGLTGYEVARHARASGYPGRLLALVDGPVDAQRLASCGFDNWLAAAGGAPELCGRLGPDLG